VTGRAGTVRAVGTCLGAGGAVAYFGVTGVFADWGAALGVAFFVMGAAFALVVWLHRRRGFHLPLPQRDVER
jgi:Flp pilus assembly protein protease CpaA